MKIKGVQASMVKWIQPNFKWNFSTNKLFYMDKRKIKITTFQLEGTQ